MPDLLLASSSRCHPGGHLDHLLDALHTWADGIDEVVFVPWARTDHDGYTATARASLGRLGVDVVGLHEAPDPVAAVAEADAVFVGGGNTFLLLDTLQRTGVLSVLADRARSGALRYLGTSAGTNVACPTIQTTNDMPVVWPADGPTAMGLVGFQVNAHFLDADPTSTHQGETRLDRLAEFHEHHDTPVLGLREHGWIRVTDHGAHVHGLASHDRAPATLVRPGEPPREVEGGTDLAAVGLAPR